MSQRIAKYEVLEKIAEGGFGTVYKARDPFIKRLVAIKTCSVADEDMARRFFREAEIAGRFDHPNVTIVHDFGVEDQTAYLVQEYLSGEDLLQKIRRRDALPLKQKVDYLIQVAKGLAYAHSQQVIHRDIKPANLRVLETGQVKILDFGIAKLATATTQLTQKGMAVGTLGYLSPEQLRDQELDTRTDIFSYGVVAYELLTYARPFQGKQLSALMDEILHRTPPPVVQFVSDCPPSLDRVVARCLEKDRDQRYQSFDEVAADLEEVRRELTAIHPVAAGAAAPGRATGEREAIRPPSTAVPAPQPRRDKAERDGGPITRPIELPRAAGGGGSATSPPSPKSPSGPASPSWPAPPLPPRQAAATISAAAARTASMPVAQARGDEGGVATAPPPPPPLLPPIEGALPSLVPPPLPLAPAERDELESGPSIFVPPEPPPLTAAPSQSRSAVAAAVPARTPAAAKSGLPWLWIAVGAGGLLVVAALGLWFLLTMIGDRAHAPAAATAVPTRATTASAVAAAATVTILGTPWGEVESLRDAAGRAVPLPARRETPLVLPLPAGHYVATLRHPAAAAPASCEVDVASGQPATCRAELLPIEPLQYFKEAGWWK
ncbi:MAG TPA: serine/threonine-protein kinase [Thermoanaerobaculia bacterium]|nr:serine/threonine-protein kinase [Thermoanaerobaculia bacterium]